MKVFCVLSDTISRINSGIISRKISVNVMKSCLSNKILKVLLNENFISCIEDMGNKFKVYLKYDYSGSPCVNKFTLIKFLSINSVLRIKHRSVNNFIDVGKFWIITTSRGILTFRNAKRLKVGGILLIQVE